MRLTTTDLFEGSFFHSEGIEPAEMWLDSGKRRRAVVFAFESDNRLLELQRAYHDGAAMVNLAAYRRSLEEMKERMFSLVRGETQTQKASVRHAADNPKFVRF